MKKCVFFIVILNLFWLTSCQKEDHNTELGGSTDLLLTKVDSVSGVSLTYDNQYIGSTDMKVIANQKGVVTYHGKMDLSGISESMKLKALDLLPKLMDYYKITNLKINENQEIDFTFNLKITSEGYLDYFTEGKPWVMARYEDGVGTEYTITNEKGQQLVRRITEKSGVDEWPLGFYLIKTSLVEHVPPADNPVFNKVSYRLNHRFGLVYVEFELKDGSKLGIDIYAFHV